MNLAGVCIAEKPQHWNLPIPLHTYTDGWRPTEREVLRGRIDYLSERRNKAVEKTLGLLPETTHILMIDSYYVSQDQVTSQLIQDYEKTAGNLILGAAIWARLRFRLSHVFTRGHMQFYDQWAVPDARWMPYGWRPESDWLASRFHSPLQGLYRVCSVGGAYIFPRTVWDNGLRYRCPDDLHGCEHNWFCEQSGLPVYLDLNAEYERIKRYSIVKCARCSLGDWFNRMGWHNPRVPNIRWILKNRVLLPRRRYEWLKGTMEKDGFKWTVRGLSDSWLSYRGHEDWLKNEILQPGRLFVDVGAHVGTWTVRASRYYENVAAFEPTDRTRKLLERNLAMNRVGNVTVFKAALGAKRESTVIHYFPRVRFDGGNSLLSVHPLVTGQGHVLNRVLVQPLDDYVFTPDLVKIDTEGYELPVLQGARETLKRTRKVIVEIHGKDNLSTVSLFLDRLGFRTQSIIAPQETHIVGERDR